MNEMVLYEKCRNVSFDIMHLPNFLFIQGVPGCWKTTYIINNVKLPFSSLGDLVLFPTCKGAVDFRKRLQEKYSKLDTSKFIKSHYKTIDSYLMHDDAAKYDRLIVDEALMVHFDSIVFAILKSGVKEVILLGDKLQIPYINRTPAVQVIYSELKAEFVDRVEYPSVSYMCTATVAALLTDAYDDGMKFVSRVTNEMDILQYTRTSKVWRRAPQNISI